MAVVYQMPGSFCQFPENESQRVRMTGDYPEIKPRETIFTFPTLSPEAVERTVEIPGLILVCWRYAYKEQTGSIVSAVYVPKDGPNMALCQWFIQDTTGNYFPYEDPPHSWTFGEVAHQMRGRETKYRYCAPAYLLQYGPDRRREYLESLDKPPGEPQKKRDRKKKT
jgi:hypothetical protein